MRRNKHPTEQELRRQFLKESRAIFSQMIDEKKPSYLWTRCAVRVLRAWRAQKIVLGVDSTLPDHYKIDPPVFVDGWVEDGGEQVRRGAGHFAIFATFYDDDEARRALEVAWKVSGSSIGASTGHDETGRHGGFDAPKCWASRSVFWVWEIEQDNHTRELEAQKKL